MRFTYYFIIYNLIFICFFSCKEEIPGKTLNTRFFCNEEQVSFTPSRQNNEGAILELELYDESHEFQFGSADSVKLLLKELVASKYSEIEKISTDSFYLPKVGELRSQTTVSFFKESGIWVARCINISHKFEKIQHIAEAVILFLEESDWVSKYNITRLNLPIRYYTRDQLDTDIQ